MAKDIEVKGLKEIQQMFESLPKQVNQKAIWQKFWRLNSKPFINAFLYLDLHAYSDINTSTQNIRI